MSDAAFIAELQRRLLDRGYDLGPSRDDGDAGPLTAAAWRAEQLIPEQSLPSALYLQTLAVLIALGVDPSSEARPLAVHLSEAGRPREITTPRRLAMWLAQLAHESSTFRRLEESLSYSAERLVTVWPRRFPTLAHARPYAGQPEKLANHVYGGRADLGNTEPGDGWKYRGGGYTMLTGRANYQAAAQAVGLPLIEHPELAREPRGAALIAAWFWGSRGCNALADRDDLEGCTRLVNGALIGIEDRRRRWDLARRALGLVA